MTRYVFKMPDLGEGTVEAEVVAWHVKVGDTVQEDQVMAEVMTDKAAVEVPSPVTGRVVAINGQPGDLVRVGSALIVFDTESSEELAAAPSSARAEESPKTADRAPAVVAATTAAAPAAEVKRTSSGPRSTAPAVAGRVQGPSPVDTDNV